MRAFKARLASTRVEGIWNVAFVPLRARAKGLRATISAQFIPSSKSWISERAQLDGHAELIAGAALRQNKIAASHGRRGERKPVVTAEKLIRAHALTAVTKESKMIRLDWWSP